MFDLKTLDELEEAIELMFQEVDASKQTKSKHLLKRQFRMALDRIGGLEKTNKRLKSELENCPEYQQRQLANSLSAYMSVFK